MANLYGAKIATGKEKRTGRNKVKPTASFKIGQNPAPWCGKPHQSKPIKTVGI